MKTTHITGVGLAFALACSMQASAETQVNNFLGEMARSPGFSQAQQGAVHATNKEILRNQRNLKAPVYTSNTYIEDKSNTYIDEQFNTTNYENSTVTSLQNTVAANQNVITANGDDITITAEQIAKNWGALDGKVVKSNGVAAVDGEVYDSTGSGNGDDLDLTKSLYQAPVATP